MTTSSMPNSLITALVVTALVGLALVLVPTLVRRCRCWSPSRSCVGGWGP